VREALSQRRETLSQRVDWPGIWTPQRARLWLFAAAIAAWLPALGMPLRGFLDFSAFYVAGSFAGTPAVLDVESIVLLQQARGLPITPFVYPPSVALAYAPLALLPYGLAAVLHIALMLGALALAARIGANLYGLRPAWAYLGAAAWAPAAASVISGQNATLALLLTALAGAALLRRRDGLAGIATGILAYKPQLAAPVFGFLVVRGRVLALATALALLGGHYWLGFFATGGDIAWPIRWLEALQSDRYAVLDLAANGWQAVSLPAFLARSQFLLDGMPSLAPVGYLLGGLVVIACLPGIRRWRIPAALALACAAGLVVSPHAWTYDATLLLPALALVAADAAERGWPWRDRWLLAIVYTAGLLWPLGGVVGFVPLAPIVWVAPLFLLARFDTNGVVGQWLRRRFPQIEPEGTGRRVAV
jgi:alpha-1,2-mannosyltransferase